MPRRNKAVGRKNNRMNRRPQGLPRVKMDVTIARVELSDLVIPDGKCYRNPRRGKDMFIGEGKAKRALEQAQRQRARMGSTYVEKRYYSCDWGGKRHFHLTSRETFEERGKA